MAYSPHETKTVLAHLAELRTKIFIAIVALIIGCVIAHIYHQEIIHYILRPTGDQHLIFLSPLDPLFFILKIDLLAGIIVAFPVLIWCFFSYIKPALPKHSRVILLVVTAVSALLIIGGLYYAYFITVPLTLKFLLSITIPGIESTITAANYLQFFLTQAIIIMLIFQIPIVIVAGFSLGIFTVKGLSAKRRYIYLIATIALAIITPTTDMFSLGIMLLPMVAIFELSLIVGRIMDVIKKKKQI